MFPRADIEVARNPVASWNYCLKDDRFKEERIIKGVAPRPNKNNKVDLAEHNRILASQPSWVSVDQGIFPFAEIRKLEGAKKLYDQLKGKPDKCESLENYWIWGPGGVGKSHFLFNAFKPEELYLKGCHKWWDGYDGQRVAAINEFDPEEARKLTAYIKLWADVWPFSGEIKGGSLTIRPKMFVITSNDDPKWIYNDNAALLRRFKIVFTGKLGEPTQEWLDLN